MNPVFSGRAAVSIRRDFVTPLLLFTIAAAFVLTGCGAQPTDALPDSDWPEVDTSRYRLVARIAHISDAQVVDEESPGRTAALWALNEFAWRAHERYSLHLLDGMIRAVNAYHARVAPIDFLIHTGDALDNAQYNELRWFLDCMDGRTLDPLSGVDDRAPGEREPPHLDPHAPFRAEGLYRQGMHGDAPSIPWYAAMGNHDRFAVGVFPLVRRLDGGLMAPLFGGPRIGVFLPATLVPDGALSYGAITPAHPGPPPQLLLPTWVLPNPERRFIAAGEFVDEHFQTITQPPGHGFAADGRTWYAVKPAPDLRLIVLDTSRVGAVVPGGIYHFGGIDREQADFLRAELARADAADELVLLATHHPSRDLSVLMGTTMTPVDLRALLNSSPRVVAHLAGHTHCHRVVNRGGYMELVTAGIIDVPQQGRIVEVWRGDGLDVVLRYASFSHLYTGDAFDGLADELTDPFLELRRIARSLAGKPPAECAAPFD